MCQTTNKNKVQDTRRKNARICRACVVCAQEGLQTLRCCEYV